MDQDDLYKFFQYLKLLLENQSRKAKQILSCCIFDKTKKRNDFISRPIDIVKYENIFDYTIKNVTIRNLIDANIIDLQSRGMQWYIWVMINVANIPVYFNNLAQEYYKRKYTGTEQFPIKQYLKNNKSGVLSVYVASIEADHNPHQVLCVTDGNSSLLVEIKNDIVVNVCDTLLISNPGDDNYFDSVQVIKFDNMVIL